MKLCPRCREEYLDHMEECRPCGEKLISEHQAQALATKTLSKEALLEGDVIPLLEGAMSHCREIEKCLIQAGISCAVYPKSLTCDSHGQTLGSSCGVTYLVLINPSDMEHAKQALEGQFLAAVAKEGQGEAARHAINLDDELIACPACDHKAPLHEGECANCGLVLALPV